MEGKIRLPFIVSRALITLMVQQPSVYVSSRVSYTSLKDDDHDSVDQLNGSFDRQTALWHVIGRRAGHTGVITADDVNQVASGVEEVLRNELVAFQTPCDVWLNQPQYLLQHVQHDLIIRPASRKLVTVFLSEYRTSLLKLQAGRQIGSRALAIFMLKAFGRLHKNSDVTIISSKFWADFKIELKT